MARDDRAPPTIVKPVKADVTGEFTPVQMRCKMKHEFRERSVEEQRALLGLTQVTGVGAGMAIRLLEHWGTALAVWAASEEELRQVHGVGDALIERLHHGYNPREVDRILTLLDDLNMDVWLHGSSTYPKSLYRLSSPPLLLYSKGNLEAPWHSNQSVAFVGTRRPDAHGVQLTQSMVRPLAQDRWCIVSGGALGIDATAHRAALNALGSTVAVLASGLDRPYPPQNRDLFRMMVERGGALLSEFPPGTKPEKGYFPRRNRLISALSAGVVVVQCGAKSGALHTATCAWRIDVPVMTFPGRPNDPLAAGPHHLIRTGAHLVASVSDIEEVLTSSPGGPAQLSLWSTPGPTHSKDSATPATMTPGLSDGSDLWKKILKNLPVENHCTKAIDVIAIDVDAPVEDVSSALILMELEGMVWTSGDLSYGRLV